MFLFQGNCSRHVIADSAGAVLMWVAMCGQSSEERRQQLFSEWALIQAPGFTPALVEKAWQEVSRRPSATVEALLESLQRVGWQTNLARTAIEGAHRRLAEARLIKKDLASEWRLTTLGGTLFDRAAYAAYLGSLSARAEFWRASNARIYVRDRPGIGSAFFVSPHLAVTAKHVCEGFAGLRYSVVDEAGVEYTPVAEHAHPDPTVDLACVEVAPAFAGVPMTLSWGPALLDEVVAFGYPPIAQLSDILLCTRGEVAALAKDRYGTGHDIFLLSCLVRPGNSGGPILGPDGTVVGVISRNLHHQSGGSGGEELHTGLGMAAGIPSRYLREIAAARHLFEIAEL